MSTLNSVRFAVFGQNVIGVRKDGSVKYGPTSEKNQVEIKLWARPTDTGVENVKDVIERLKYETGNATFKILEVELV